MDTRGAPLLIVVAVVVLLAGGVLCMFHGDDFHAGVGHLCLIALAVGATAVPFASPRSAWLGLEPPARPFVTLEGLAPPPRS